MKLGNLIDSKILLEIIIFTKLLYLASSSSLGLYFLTVILDYLLGPLESLDSYTKIESYFSKVFYLVKFGSFLFLIGGWN